MKTDFCFYHASATVTDVNGNKSIRKADGVVRDTPEYMGMIFRQHQELLSATSMSIALTAITI